MEELISAVDYSYLEKLGLSEKTPEWLKICAENKEEGINDE
jgi:hypothetical protein